MQKEVQIFRDEHSVALTNGELKTIILNAARAEFPETPPTGGATIVFGEDAAGKIRARIVWKESARPVHVKR